jgi:uncharacterized protein with HEPN domain
MEKRDRLYIKHIHDAADRISTFTSRVTFEDFKVNEMLQSAVIHQLLVIGEAANKVSDEFQQAHPELNWRGMIGMRNKLIHDYFHASTPKSGKQFRRTFLNLSDF